MYLSTDNPLVSIIIPTYNRELYIETAIISAINQTYRHIEVIIGDNCSTDNTWQILKKWSLEDKRIIIFQNQTNIGPVLNWLECFKRARGSYIKIIWSDDWISTDFIEKSIAILKEDVAFVISGYQIIREGSIISEIKYNKELYSVSEYFENILLYNEEKFPVSPGCALFRSKDVFSNFIIDIPNSDKLDSKTNGAGNDLLLYLNIAIHYSYIATLAESKSYFRAHRESFSISSNLNLYYEWSKVSFIKKHLTKTPIENIKKYILFRFLRKDDNYKNVFRELSFNSMIFKSILKYIYIVKRIH